ncbi:MULTISPECIES: hypothetical protein [Klebsiella/Raoultella group]|uniref:Uncharacterized protein n=1 Tax=Raoultella ornithinolytica TaxID=54291 RepID=A0A9Q9J9S9_RAOOR|nr:MULTISPECIES: hypothetical protein [Klebsiella/Raoultella group]MDI0348485.1 hypothetical protein [Raoultella ornithinolytica]MDI0399217.1 hypothetical protein [Raoultella ornithinolytica]MDI9191456.1 hypothetical protein [Raoultella ornithinolytica]UXE36139.1 hypothetical protein N2J37_16405 [Raoultella ornithinolytica]HDO7161484.1 hypothetical protein [Klebsiella pneumoniae]
MSFTVTKSVKCIASYPEYGAESEITTVNKLVKFSARQVVSLDAENNAQVLFDVEIEGASITGTYYHSFTYSGTGSPIEEAERSLGNALAG